MPGWDFEWRDDDLVATHGHTGIASPAAVIAMESGEQQAQCLRCDSIVPVDAIIEKVARIA